jgi:hypothetical protein
MTTRMTSTKVEHGRNGGIMLALAHDFSEPWGVTTEPQIRGCLGASPLHCTVPRIVVVPLVISSNLAKEGLWMFTCGH